MTSQPQPGRFLGDANGAALSDQPYSNLGPAEIVSFNDAPADEPPPTESTALLSSAHRVRPRTSPRSGRSPTPSEDPPSFRDPVSGETPKHTSARRPISLRLSFIFACILVYVNLSGAILTISGVSSPFMAHNALPPHFGSSFMPIWLTILALFTNVLTLVSFVAPSESPALAVRASFASAFVLLVQLILILAVGQLRHRENVLTLVTVGIAIVSTLHAGASASLVASYAPLLVPPPPRPSRERLGFTASLARLGREIFAFVTVSAPIVIVHTAIFLAFFLLTLSVILRAYDASLAAPGQLWKVNPWRRRTNTGVTEMNGRPYLLHLACRGIEPIDPSLWTSQATNSNATAEIASGARGVRRTILIETDQGVPGSVGAEWVIKMLRDGTLTSADTDIRVCYYDRPGYGFSDNSPSSSIPRLVSALSHALALSGEIARLEPSPTFIPSPLARSGFILVSKGYGSLPTTLFASLNAHLIHSVLYLQPLPPSLHYSYHQSSFFQPLTFFFTSALESWASELGLERVWSTLHGASRAARVLSTEHDALRGEIMRSFLQESKELHSPGGKSAVVWGKTKARYPERPTVVLSPQKTSGQYGYGEAEWIGGQEEFVKNVVGRGLVEWEKGWEGKCGSGEGDVCRESLLRLVRMD